MLECEGYKMFKGSAFIRPTTVNFTPFHEIHEIGTFLYKPDTKCWYVNGNSYPAEIVEQIEDDS